MLKSLKDEDSIVGIPDASEILDALQEDERESKVIIAKKNFKKILT
ncbi:MAG: hypothetical protein ACOX3T_06775 [Bdellovibrionota bacterium]